MRKENISNAVIRRLPRYYRNLTELLKNGVTRISSGELAKSMGLTASQIRQDLSCFGGFGLQGYGYNTERLLSELSGILGIDRKHTAVILGAGNLGRALMGNSLFPESGFQLLAAFDISPDLVDTTLNGIPIYHIDTMGIFLQEHEVSIGILTVPSSSAVSSALALEHCGVKGIWNFTNQEIPVSGDNPQTKIENVHLADSLLTLSYMISEGGSAADLEL